MQKRITIFISIILVIFICLNIIFTPNWNYPMLAENHTIALTEFNRIDYGIDVFFLGSSHMKYAISPMQLYAENGIISYNLGTSSQELDETEYLVKEIIKKSDKPKLIVIDASSLFYDSVAEYPYRYITDSTNMDYEKFQLIKGYVNKKEYKNFLGKEEELLSFIFPFFRYHSRWDELEISDFSDLNVSNYFNQGYCPVAYRSSSYASYENNEELTDLVIDNQSSNYVETAGANNKIEVRQDNQYNTKVITDNIIIMQNIVNECKENNVQVLLTKIPLNMSGATYNSAWGEKRHDEVAQIANKLEIPFYDMNYEDIGLDWTYDTMDAGMHQNYLGATKTSKAMGEYILNNYGISPKQNEEYDRKLENYDKNKKVLELESEYDFHDYLDILKKNGTGYTIIFSAQDDMISGLSDMDKVKLAELGLETDFDSMSFRDSYIAIINARRIEVESASNRQQTYNSEINGSTLTIKSAGFLDGLISSILINGNEHSMNRRGLNIVVIDNESGLVIDKSTCDTFSPEHEVYHDIGSLDFEYEQYLLGRK